MSTNTEAVMGNVKEDQQRHPGAMRGESAADLAPVLSQILRVFVDLPDLTVDDAIHGAVAEIGHLIGADLAFARHALRDGQTAGVTHQWVRPGIAPRPIEDALRGFPWVAAELRRRRGPVVISRLDELPTGAWRDRRSFEEHRITSLAVYPLLAGGTLVGGLAFATVTREHTWPAVVLVALQRVSDIVGGALARQRAQRRLQDTVAFERLFAELSATFIDLPPEQVDEHLDGLLARVAEVLDLDRSTVSQRSVTDGLFQRPHQWVRDGFAPLPPLMPEQSVPWLVRRILGGDAVIFSNVSELPSEAILERELIARHGPKSSAILPLAVGGRVVGAVTFCCLSDSRRWDADTIGRLRLVAQIVGGAVARKRTHMELHAALDENEFLRRRLQAENASLRTDVKNAGDDAEVVGRSQAICAVLHTVNLVARTDVSVLLLGETGTGKELIARAVHAGSVRSARPLITVNCAALPPSLIESELFGHEKGAFTGAIQARRGRFELADGGTLFLDEIGDLEPPLQAKLLRALQGGEIERLGSSRTHKVDVRVIAATNRDLDAAMAEGRFRADLFYRLSVLPIKVPSLRERREDIPLLVWHFIQSRQRELGRLIQEIPKASMEALLAYDWPGNVRELQNIIDRALIFSTGPTLRIEEALGFAGAVPTASRQVGGIVEALGAAERAHIIAILDRCDWAIQGRHKAAERLGLRPSTLRNRMRKLGIRRPQAA